MHILTGDMILTRSNSFLSKGIIYHNIKYGLKKGLEFDSKDIFSHAGILVWRPEGLKVFESVARGKKIRNFSDRYTFDSPDIAVYRPKMLLLKEEQDKLIETGYKLAELNWRYQFEAFPQWMARIWLGRDWFIKDNPQTTNCYESAYRMYQGARPWSFPHRAEGVSFFEITDPMYMNRVPIVEPNNIYP